MAKKNLKEPAPTAVNNNLFKMYVLLALVSVAVYFNTFTGDFVFDDESVVLGDPSIMHLSNIPKYFTGQEGFHKVIGRYYRPVVSTSYALDYFLWEYKPIGFHITNVMIHVLNTLLVFKLLLLLFKNYQHKYKTYFLMLGAGLFAVNPIHTEAVAWVSGRTDSLFFTFYAAAFIFYLKYKEEPTTRNLVLISLMYLLSLMAKEMAITFPAIIILYEYLINKKRKLDDFAGEKLFYISASVVSVVYLLIRWLVLKDVPERVSYYYFYGKNEWTVLFTMLQAVPLYFRLVLLPFGMLYHYSGYMPYMDTFFHYEVIFAVVIIIVLLVCAYLLKERLSWVAFAVFFIFITLLPVLNVVPTMNFMADRFLYLPSLAVSFAAVGLLIKYFTPSRAVVIYSAAGVFILFYVFLTVTRNTDWRTNNSLFMSADGRPGTITYVNIGNIYANKGEYDKAEVYFRKAIDLRPETILANCNLGKVFMIKGMNDSAFYYMNRAYMYDTLSPEPMYSIAVLMNNTGRPYDAVKWLKKVHAVGPGYMDSKVMLNQILDRLGTDNPNVEAPIQTNNELPKLEQKSYEQYSQKDYKGAIETLKKLIEMNPDNSWSYYNNMGMCYLDSDDYKQAEKCFKDAINAKPNFSIAFFNLGTTYERMGKKDKAIESFKSSLALDPNNKDAKKKLNELQKK